MRIAWLTDIHLDFLTDCSLRDPYVRVREFATRLEADCDAYLITGDVSVSDLIIDHLDLLASCLGHHVYFVLGNHDYYRGSVHGVRTKVRDICRARAEHLTYLTSISHVSLTPSTALVGHDGWYDGRFGRPFDSNVFMNDWRSIEDFRLALYTSSTKEGGVLSTARKLADQGASHVVVSAAEAARTHKRVIIATHVPPFEQAAVYHGQPSSPGSLPWYTARSMGEVILDLGREFPDVSFDVFCGHTHNPRVVRMSDNITCSVGESEYGDPGLAGYIDVV